MRRSGRAGAERFSPHAAFRGGSRGDAPRPSDTRGSNKSSGAGRHGALDSRPVSIAGYGRTCPNDASRKWPGATLRPLGRAGAAAARLALPGPGQDEDRHHRRGPHRRHLAKLWAEAGYPVMLSARNLDEVKKQAAGIGHGVAGRHAGRGGRVRRGGAGLGALRRPAADRQGQCGRAQGQGRARHLQSLCQPRRRHGEGGAGERHRRHRSRPICPARGWCAPSTRSAPRSWRRRRIAPAKRSACRWPPTTRRRSPSPNSLSPTPASSRWWWAGFPPPRASIPAPPAYHTMTAKQLRAMLGLK